MSIDPSPLHVAAASSARRGQSSIASDVYVYRGTPVQPPDDYLEAKIGEDLPGWRRVCYAVFRHIYLGTSPYIKAVSAVVRRSPNGLSLTGGAHNIGGDANPACMIYDLLVSPPAENGLGLPQGFLDLEAFRAVGQTLAAEGLGAATRSAGCQGGPGALDGRLGVHVGQEEYGQCGYREEIGLPDKARVHVPLQDLRIRSGILLPG